MSVLKLCLKIGSTIKLMVSKISIYIIERALKLDNVHTMKLNKEPGDCVLPWWRWPRERYGIMIDVGHGWHKKCHTLWQPRKVGWGGGWEVGGRSEREGTYVYLWLIRVAVWQKPTQYCKAIILRLKKKEMWVTKGPASCTAKFRFCPRGNGNHCKI